MLKETYEDNEDRIISSLILGVTELNSSNILKELCYLKHFFVSLKSSRQQASGLYSSVPCNNWISSMVGTPSPQQSSTFHSSSSLRISWKQSFYISNRKYDENDVLFQKVTQAYSEKIRVLLSGVEPKTF